MAGCPHHVSLMGRLSTRHLRVAIQLGEEAIGYVFGAWDKGLEYKRCEESRRHGEDAYLPFTRCMRRLEVFADVSFAPNAGRSVQGIVAGSPVQWESSRQSCMALSTAEGELYSYMEASTMAGAILEILEQTPRRTGWMADPELEVPEELEGRQEEFWTSNPDCIQKVLYGDSTAAVGVASKPDGPWRTRHLRLRCNGLREKVQQGGMWAIRHIPGAELVADYLTKPITVRARWSQFYSFMGRLQGAGRGRQEGRRGRGYMEGGDEEAGTGQYGSGSTLTLGCS